MILKSQRNQQISPNNSIKTQLIEHGKLFENLAHILEIQNEVQTKSFLLSTFLTPLLILGFMGFMVFMTVSDNEAPKQVIVIDETGQCLIR